MYSMLCSILRYIRIYIEICLYLHLLIYLFFSCFSCRIYFSVCSDDPEGKASYLLEICLQTTNKKRENKMHILLQSCTFPNCLPHFCFSHMLTKKFFVLLSYFISPLFSCKSPLIRKNQWFFFSLTRRFIHLFSPLSAPPFLSLL